MKIFISGSREGTKFTKYKELGAWLKENNHTVLVGDCYGVDTKIQQLCKDNDIKCVVYHIGYKPRNNMGFETIKVPGNKYADKDVQMSMDCNAGIAIWNGTSKGTKANIDRLKNLGKQVIVR